MHRAPTDADKQKSAAFVCIKLPKRAQQAIAGGLAHIPGGLTAYLCVAMVE